jgi:hypothetical protein
MTGFVGTGATCRSALYTGELAGATVAIVAGVNAGLTTVTSHIGRFDFSDVMYGPVTLRVTKAGYVEAQSSFVFGEPNPANLRPGYFCLTPL